MPPPPDLAISRKPYLDQLTALRGLACLFVLAGHVIQVFNYMPAVAGSPSYWAGQVIRGLFNAEGAVLLFFVLSGCVLALSLQNAAGLGRRAVAGFYIKRVFRLYPLLWLSTFVAIGGVFVAHRLLDQGVFVTWLQLNLEAPVTPAHTLLSMAGIWTKYDGPMWSLRVELIYSALFPLIYLLISHPRRRWWFIAALAAIALLPVPDPQYGTAFALSFGLGALIPFLPRAARPRILLPWAALIVLCYDRVMLSAYHPPDILYDIIETIAAFVLVRDVYQGRRRYVLLSYRPLIRIGELSFSVYLLHLPLLLMIFTAVAHVTGAAALLGHPALAQIGLGALTIAATLPLAALTYGFVEAPLHHAGRRFAARVAQAGASGKTAGLTPAAGLAPRA